MDEVSRKQHPAGAGCQSTCLHMAVSQSTAGIAAALMAAKPLGPPIRASDAGQLQLRLKRKTQAGVGNLTGARELAWPVDVLFLT